jgi:hypothetical protein
VINLIISSYQIAVIMGVYYYFFNQRTGEKNLQPIPNFGPSNFVPKLRWFKNIEEIFQSVITINPHWLATDVIHARPDYEYEPTIVYDNGVITYLNVVTDHDDIYSTYIRGCGYGR